MKKLNKCKGFLNLSEEYKSSKFIALYSRMYEYMLSIPKEKIIIKTILERNEYIRYLFEYISKFLEAKDFYHWKNRFYFLLTEKIGSTNYKNYELLYRSKAKEFYDKYLEKTKITNLDKYDKEYVSQVKEIKEKIKEKNINKSQEEKEQIKEKRKVTNLKRLGYENPMQSKEVQEKYKTTCLEIYGYENPMQSKEVQEKVSNKLINKSLEEKEQIQEKRKATNIKKYGKKYSAQSKEVQEKQKTTNLERYGVKYLMQSKEIQEKSKATCLTKYNREHVGGWFDITSHSKFGNEVCTAIDNLLGNPEDSIYYAKSGKEYCIKDNDRSYYVDMVIPSLKLAFEADGCYFHGLIEGQKDVKGTPVEEIWKRDQEKTIAIEKAGYKLFRIREDEYFDNKSKCLENLIKEIESYIDSLENVL